MAQKVEMRSSNKKYRNYSEPDSDSDDEEFPSDTFFYGLLNKKIVSLEELSIIMTKGLKKFKDYMLVKEGEVILKENLCYTLDLWCQHDSDRNNYFDYLFDGEVSVDNFLLEVIRNIEISEKKEIDERQKINKK